MEKRSKGKEGTKRRKWKEEGERKNRKGRGRKVNELVILWNGQTMTSIGQKTAVFSTMITSSRINQISIKPASSNSLMQNTPRRCPLTTFSYISAPLRSEKVFFVVA